jgi:hypothetical protein
MRRRGVVSSFSVLEAQGFSSAGQANMVNKNVKALPAPDSKTAWVSAPSGLWSMLGCGERRIYLCVSRRFVHVLMMTASRVAFRRSRRGHGLYGGGEPWATVGIE